MNLQRTSPRPTRSITGLTLPVVCLCIASTALGCGRINFDRLDSSPPVDAARDASVDAGPQLDVRCAPWAPVSPTAPAVRLIEPALRSDGLTVLSRFSYMDQQASRGAFDGPFTDWEVTTGIRSVAEDPSFIEFEGSEIAAGARRIGETPRHLILCRPPFDTGACDQLAVFDEEGVLIVDDHDGPALALRGGDLFLAFNRGGAIYIAEPRAPDRLTWDARLVEMGPGSFDDPSLTNDGAILIASGSANTLHVAEWDAIAGTYAHAHPVIGIEGGAPEIGVESVSAFELFAGYDSRGITEPHRTSCTF